jgi:hypothetical protein
MDFIKATQETQVAEKLLNGLAVVLSLVGKALSVIPVPLLAAAIGFHSFLVYGGLFTTWLQRAALAIDGFIAKIPGMSGFATAFAQKIGASTDQLEKFASSLPGVQALAAGLGVTATQAASMSMYIQKSGMTTEEFARQTQAGSDLMDKYSTGLSDAGKNAVGLAVAMGGTEEQIAGVAKTAETAAADTGKFSKAMGSVAGFLAANWVGIAAIAAAGFAYISYEAIQASGGVKSFVDGVQQSEQQMNAAQLFVSLPQTIGQTTAQLKQAQSQWNKVAGDMNNVFYPLLHFSTAWKHSWDELWGDVFGGGQDPNQNALNAALQQQLKTFGALTQSMTGLTKQGFTFTESLGIMNAAGVSVNDSFAVMQAKVNGLLAGYEMAGQRAGIVGQDMNVLSVTSSDTATNMQKLNQAWDTWTQTVAGPINSFLALDQSMGQFATDAAQAGASMSGLGKVIASTTQGPTGSNAAIQLQQQFQTVYQNVEQLFDSVRMAEAAYADRGGIGDQFVATVKDSVAALIPLAGQNKGAAAEISALAQEAGGPATTSLSALAKWAGNVHDPMQKLYDITQQAAISASGLSQDASNLTTTLQQELIPQMAQSIISASQAGPAMESFAAAVLSGNKSVSALGPSAITLYSTLSKVAGPQNAKALFMGMAEAMGLSQQQATQLYTYVQRHPIKPKVDTKEASQKLNELAQQEGVVVKPPPPAAAGGWTGFWKNVTLDFTNWVWHPIHNFFADDIPNWLGTLGKQFSGDWQQASGYFDKYVSTPINNWFNKSLPHAFDVVGSAFISAWNTTNRWWDKTISTPMSNWFTQSLPHAFDVVKGAFQSSWDAINRWWDENISTPVSNWFTQSLPHAFDVVGSTFDKLWSTGWKNFSNYIISPMENWFTKTLPGWIGNIGGLFDSAWKSVWSTFGRDIWSPVSNFFTKTVPGWLGLASGGDPFSGSVPGSSEDDNYFAKIMGGEYVIRQPARMALEATYGRGFMDWLNQYDTVSGSGSRGILASQRPSGSGRYSGGGGILGDIGDALGGAGSFLTHLGGEALHGLEGLLSHGLEWAFNGLWDVTIGPVLNALPNRFPLDITHFLGNETRHAVDSALTGIDSKTGLGTANMAEVSSIVGGVASSGQVKTEQLYALSLFPAMGWNASQLGYLVNLWNKESGWNPAARNPTSGAAGIPQDITGNTHGGWQGQVLWGEEYIRGRYGTPAAAWAHEVADNWYAAGGPVRPPVIVPPNKPPAAGPSVVSAILNSTDNLQVREAMMLGSWLESHWQDYFTGGSGSEYGPYAIELRKHRGVSQVQADDPTWATRFMLPYYSRAAANQSRALWSAHPNIAALHAFLEAQGMGGAGASVPSNSQLNYAWGLVRNVLGGPPQHQVTGPGGGDPAQQFFYFTGRVPSSYANAKTAWGQLAAARRPGLQPSQLESQVSSLGAVVGSDLSRLYKSDQRQKMLAQIATLTRESQDSRFSRAHRAELASEAAHLTGQLKYYPGLSLSQHDAMVRQVKDDSGALNSYRSQLSNWESWVADVLITNAGETAISNAWNALSSQLGDPSTMTNAQWAAMNNAVAYWTGLVNGKVPPKGSWGAESGYHWPPGYRAGDVVPSSLLARTYFGGDRNKAIAEARWLSADTAASYNLWHAYWGERVTGTRGTPGPGTPGPQGPGPVNVNPYQFVPAGPGGSTGPGGYGFASGGLADVAAMFAGGGAVPMPTFVVPGMSMTMQKQLGAAASGTYARTLGDAAGDTIGMQVGTLNINNPVSERPSDSIARSSNRLAFMAGRGPV